MTFKFDILYSSEKHYELVDSEHNCCMNFLIEKNPADLLVFLSEVYVRILINIFYSVSNDILQMPGRYKGRDVAEQHDLFSDYFVSFICTSYIENVCPLLKPTCLLHMYKVFEIKYDYSGENLMIFNDSCLQYCVKKFK